MQKLGEYNQTTKGIRIRNTWQLEISNHEWWNRGWKPTGWRSCSRHHYIDGMLDPKTSRSLQSIHWGPFQSISKAQVRLLGSRSFLNPLALGGTSFPWCWLPGPPSSLPGNSSSWSTWLIIPAKSLTLATPPYNLILLSLVSVVLSGLTASPSWSCLDLSSPWSVISNGFPIWVFHNLKINKSLQISIKWQSLIFPL